MYQAGDLIMYGSTGVCRVESVGKLDGNPRDNTQYYKLAPVFDTETIYTPIDTKAFMRPVMTREQAEELIARIPDIPEDVCGGCDIKMLSERYRACLNTHENDDLIRLMLYGELAVALDMEFDQIQPYIKKRMGHAKKKTAES